MPRSSRRRSRGTRASGAPLRPALLRSPSQQAALSAVPETAAACLRSAGLAKWPTPPQRRSPSSPRSCCRARMDPALPVHSAGERAACSRRKNARSHWSHYSPRVAAAGCLAVCPALAGPRPAARASPPATVEYAPLRMWMLQAQCRRRRLGVVGVGGVVGAGAWWAWQTSRSLSSSEESDDALRPAAWWSWSRPRKAMQEYGFSPSQCSAKPPPASALMAGGGEQRTV